MENSKTCKNAGACGGCCYQGVAYEDQLKNKAGEVRGYLKAYGIDPTLLVEIKPCPVRYAYRNKMEYTFGDRVKSGEMYLGLHEKGRFMNIVPVDECMIVPEDYNRLVSATLKFAKEKGYIHYNKKTHTGFLRNLIIRRGVRTNQLLINIVTTSEEKFDEEEYVKLITSIYLDNVISGIFHTINDKDSDAVVCDELRLLYGREYYEEEILGLKFKVGPFSFFQTNVDAAERLYKDAISLIDGLEGKTVYDLYCGTGTITQAMAKRAKKAIGVEIVAEAIDTAKESAYNNCLSNCEFIVGDVAKVLSDIEDKPDVIVVDPPRSGIVPKAMERIYSYGVNQIVYISCNPKTMAQNLQYAADFGYEIKQITAYDNFPFTKHVETVVLMSRA